MQGGLIGPVAMQDPGAVRTGGTRSAVGMQRDLPSPAMDGNQMMEPAEQHQVRERMSSAILAMNYVMYVASCG